MNRKILCLLLAALCLSSAACADSSGDEPSGAVTTETGAQTSVAETEIPLGELKDAVPEMDFEGYEYRVLSRELLTSTYQIIVEEETGETLNDAIYARTRKLEERFNCVFSEVSNTGADYARNYIIAGEAAFDMMNVRCTTAISYFQEGMIYAFEALPYIDDSMPWWDAQLNDRITFANTRYISLGASNLSYYDATHALLFNKEMNDSYSMGDFYGFVEDGQWTFDKMASVMSQATRDLDGDGVLAATDQYGIVSAGKQIMPGFWIGADVVSVSKDSSDIPYMAMSEEKFVTVFDRIFQITRDNNTWYPSTSDDNIPDECIEIFKSNRSLFMDCTFYFIESLRDMETDFGVMPYPKWDEEQEGYHGRVEFYDPTVVPVTNVNLDQTGAMMEAMACESYKTVIPAYYEVVLKTKFSRDNSSAQMLDIIFSSRVIDLGDTVYLDFIRDKVIKDMYKKDDRDLASKVASMEASVAAEIDKTLEAISKLA